MDGDGNLIVCDEIDDAEQYRRLLFMDDTQHAATTGYGGGYGSEYGEEGGDEESYPGSGYGGSGYPMGMDGS